MTSRAENKAFSPSYPPCNVAQAGRGPLEINKHPTLNGGGRRGGGGGGGWISFLPYLRALSQQFCC